jgi:hypothetical protein
VQVFELTLLDWESLEEIFILEDLTIIQTTVTWNFTDGEVLRASAYTVHVKKPEVRRHHPTYSGSTPP